MIMTKAIADERFTRTYHQIAESLKMGDIFGFFGVEIRGILFPRYPNDVNVTVGAGFGDVEFTKIFMTKFLGCFAPTVDSIDAATIVIKNFGGFIGVKKTQLLNKQAKKKSVFNTIVHSFDLSDTGAPTQTFFTGDPPKEETPHSGNVVTL